MNTSPIKSETILSAGAVEKELENIFHAPNFTESTILKKFLSFIVQETLRGRSNCLKEYTIAVNVLDKPLNFNPQENCIVRIHAGRLRRALTQYYNDLGQNDPVVISIPKGKYIPVFNDAQHTEPMAMKEQKDRAFSVADDADIVLAILPLNCMSRDTIVKTFADGLCLQLGSMFTKLRQVSLISYQAIKHLAEAQPDYKELSAIAGFNHVITGGVQYLKNTLRVNIQLFEAATYKQVWSKVIERKLTKYNHFTIQDDICKLIVNEVGKLSARKYTEPKKLSFVVGG